MAKAKHFFETNFGFWPEEWTLNWSGGCIKPLADHQQIVSRLKSESEVEEVWYDAGERTFSLPSTHIAKLDDSFFDNHGADFVILLTGMLRGLRLQREGWQNLKRTPVVALKLCDFYADRSEMEKALGIATDFWKQANHEVRKIAFGVLHWHLFAQTYRLDFERFNGQYTALDTCHALAQKSFPGFLEAKTHADRTRMMCWQLGVPVPDWANSVVTPSNSSKAQVRVAVCRNALVHEAMFADQPIGFAASTQCHSMMLELNGLVARIFLRLIGVDNEYTRSGCQSAQRVGFAF